jgi:hypothetical protein
MIVSIITSRFYTVLLILAFVAMLATACLPQSQTTPPAELDYAQFIQDLRAAGHTVEEAGELADGVFETARTIRLNEEDLQVYEFASRSEQVAAARTISANGHNIGTNSYMWISQPYFFAKDRLIVLYLGVETDTIELLAHELGRPLTGAEGVELREQS